jgi:hypothetical protein
MADLQARFDTSNNHVDAISYLSSSQVWVNKPELIRNGFKMSDVVAYLKAYDVPFEAPYNMLAREWIARGKKPRQRFFKDVVSRDEL